MATDEELFAEATADKPEAQEETPEQQEQAEAEAQETQEKPQEEELPIAEAKKIDESEEKKRDRERHGLLMEMLNEREKRQTFERQIEDERKRSDSLERRIAELQRQQQPKPQVPDVIENPQGFVENFEQTLDRRLREQEANFSLKLAHRHYGKEFEAAYENLIREGQVNPAMVQSIVAHSDPGEALMLWHKQRTLMEKVGGDFDGYMKKREEELLKDPEFRKRFAETLRSEQSSSSQSTERPASVVQIPPSLSKASGAAPKSADDTDISDEGLFRYATRR